MIIIETIKRLFRPAPALAAPETVVVDQASYYDAQERKSQRWREDQEAEERQRERIAYMVWEWSRDVVRKRMKQPLPPKLPRNDVVREWLDGLFVQEIFALAKSDGWTIAQHVYGNVQIDAVRPVQPLPEAELRFPAAKAETDEGRAGAGGGPRKPK